MSKLINILIVVVVLSAAAVLLYPTVSDQYNKYQNARRILAYNRVIETLDTADNDAMLEAARAYNASLTGNNVGDAFSGEGGESSPLYRSLLDPNGNGVMAVIEIPKIGVRLPVYHSTDAYGLERGVGHMEGTALPVGGEGTHCGIAGHRALPSARLFTDLDQMERGDLIYLRVLDNLLAYRVDKVYVVLPHETEYMAPVPGEDLVTLVTCTPYGVNTHRLLVRGARVTLEDVADQLAESDAVTEAEPYMTILIGAAPTALIGLLLMLLIRPKRRFGLK